MLECRMRRKKDKRIVFQFLLYYWVSVNCKSAVVLSRNSQASTRCRHFLLCATRCCYIHPALPHCRCRVELDYSFTSSVHARALCEHIRSSFFPGKHFYRALTVQHVADHLLLLPAVCTVWSLLYSVMDVREMELVCIQPHSKACFAL